MSADSTPRSVDEWARHLMRQQFRARLAELNSRSSSPQPSRPGTPNSILTRLIAQDVRPAVPDISAEDAIAPLPLPPSAPIVGETSSQDWSLPPEGIRDSLSGTVNQVGASQPLQEEAPQMALKSTTPKRARAFVDKEPSIVVAPFHPSSDTPSQATGNHNEEQGSTIGTIFGNVLLGNRGTVYMNYGGDPELSKILKNSPQADYRYCPSGAERVLRRTSCTAGTRVRILKAIRTWATDRTPESEPLFWLSGQAGSGKTTIAHTICSILENLTENAVILGASFFCSRQFAETRSVVAIVRTIVYQLALRSRAFRDALLRCGKLDAVDHTPEAQLLALLVGPWQVSAPGRFAEGDFIFVIPIDALDELESGMEDDLDFLSTLLDVIEEHDLTGLKFFVTSRSVPSLVERISAFTNKQICRLEHVPINESNEDIKTFLIDKVGKWASGDQIRQLVADAGGLFIYASTMVKFLQGRNIKEQGSLLNLLLSGASSHPRTRDATTGLDHLYLQILTACLVDERDRANPSVFQECLAILHTFLCTIERTSADVATGLLCAPSSTREGGLDPGVADGVVDRLHALLYVQDGQVMWFHKSFPDFIFNQQRSHQYFCNGHELHRRLAESCFGILNKELRFNIADIPSSFRLDKDDKTLLDRVETTIKPSLRYACQYWGAHLASLTLTAHDPLCTSLCAFLQLPALFWLESMSLLGKRGQCAGTLREIQKPIQVSKELVNMTNEAAAFADYHSTSKAAASTPHLYISSLSTFPHSGPLIQGWRAQFEGLLAFTHATNKHAHHAVFTIGAPINGISVSHKGTTAVLGCEDTTVRLWDLSVGEEVMTLKGHTDWVRAVALSPDEKSIVSGSDDTTVRIWDASTGEELKVLKGHDKGVYAVAWSPDGTHIVSGSSDRTARVWDASTGEAKTLEGHTGDVNAISYSSDGIHIASASYDGTVRVWDVRTAATVKTFTGHTSWVMAVAFSPDGSHIVSGSYDGTVRVWSMESGEEVKRFEGHTRKVRAVAYSPDGARVASGSYDGTVRMWDVTGQEVKKFEGHTGPVNAVAFSNQGTHLVSGSSDGTLRVWDLSLGSNAEESEAQLGEVYAAAFSPDGTYIALGGSDESIRVWNVSAGAEVQKLDGHSATIWSISYTPNGSRLVSGSEDGTIRVWDVSTGQEVKTLEGHASGVNAVACSSDGRHAASGSDDKTVRIWDMSTGTEVWRMEGHTERVWAVVYSSDSTHVVSASADGTVRVWDVSTGREVRKLEGHNDEVNTVACSPDGVHVASGSDDETVRIWDISTGQQVLVLEGHTDLVWSVCYSPDGGYVVSGSHYKTVRVWDASTGQEVRKLEGHSSVIRAVAYSPDGTYILSGSDDKTVRLWDVSAKFQRRYTRQKDHRGAHTGWLVHPSDPSAHLMFVQPLFGLPDDRNTSTIPPSAFPHLDLSNAKLGPQWAECYTPKA